MDAELFLRLIAALGGVAAIAGVFRYRFEARKAKADTHKADTESAVLIQDAALRLLVPLQQEIARLGAELVLCKEELKRLREELGNKKGP